MRLLVSVRAAEEVAAALEGGADIIDAKEPARGALGPVSPEALLAIAALVPDSVPLSVALGDFTDPDAVRLAVAGARVLVRRGPIYLKLGFAGERSEAAITSLVAAAIEAAAATERRPVVVPVAYADHTNADSATPEEALRAATVAGARAFLIDTWLKDGRGLLQWMAMARLRGLAAGARSARMLLAVAGSLDLTALVHVAGIADVIGVRGAACRGGRAGSVDAGLVRQLRLLVRPLAEREASPSGRVSRGRQTLAAKGATPRGNRA